MLEAGARAGAELGGRAPTLPVLAVEDVILHGTLGQSAVLGRAGALAESRQHVLCPLLARIVAQVQSK